MQDTSGGGTVAMLFELATKAEQLAQEIYIELSKRYTDLPEVAGFWRDMAKDEATHAKKLRELCETLTPEQLDAPTDPLILWKAQEAATISVEDNLHSVQALEDAYQLAHKLEYSEINAVFEFIMTEFVAYKDQRDFVVAQLQDHVGRLEAFGSSRWRDSDIWRS